MSPCILAVTGLKREAACITGSTVLRLASGGDALRLTGRLQALISPAVQGVISIGIAGGLDPALKLGEAVIATAIEGPAERWPVDEPWSRRVAHALGGARRAIIVGSNGIVATADAKAELYQSSRAACVDMESHVAASVAAAHALPFIALRFISDTADRALPPAALAGMTPEGGMDVIGVLKALLVDPRQLPSLLQTGKDAEVAFRALLGGCRRLGATLGFADV